MTRADEIRERLSPQGTHRYGFPDQRELDTLVPPGSVILTPDEAEKLRNVCRRLLAQDSWERGVVDEALAILGGGERNETTA